MDHLSRVYFHVYIISRADTNQLVCIFDGGESHSEQSWELRKSEATKGLQGRMHGEGRALLRLRVNRAASHTGLLTSCEACSQWEMNLQRMFPSDIFELPHWSLLRCSRRTIVVLSTVPLMALIHLNVWETFTFRLQRREGCAGKENVCTRVR